MVLEQIGSSLRGGRIFAAAFTPVACLCLAGCASPGAPRPPSLHLPEPVTVTAVRRGPAVVLQFVTPAKSTDGIALTGPAKASLCRAVGTGACVPTESFPAQVVVNGPVTWTDVLPRRLAEGLPQKLTYTVEVFNAVGRTAGPSAAVVVPSGSAPAAVMGLHAGGERDGIVLHWEPAREGADEVLLKRETVERLGEASGVVKTAPAAKPSEQGRHKRGPAFASPGGKAADAEPGVVLLRASEGGGQSDLGGTVDATAVAGTLYRYTAVRSRRVTLDGQVFEVRSVASAPVEFTLHDVYPPAVPTGLQAAEYPLENGAGIAVDLVWQPNGEADLAGYNVFRQIVAAEGAGVAEKLNAQLLTLPSFHDVGVKAGMHVRYTVVAVDKSGNVSGASVAADVVAAAQ